MRPVIRPAREDDADFLAWAILAAQRGHTKAQLTFLIGNDAAQRSYRKAGFRFAEERRSLEFESVVGAPGLRRCEREI